MHVKDPDPYFYLFFFLFSKLNIFPFRSSSLYSVPSCFFHFSHILPFYFPFSLSFFPIRWNKKNSTFPQFFKLQVALSNVPFFFVGGGGQFPFYFAMSYFGMQEMNPSYLSNFRMYRTSWLSTFMFQAASRLLSEFLPLLFLENWALGLASAFFCTNAHPLRLLFPVYLAPILEYQSWAFNLRHFLLMTYSKCSIISLGPY
jgi:hypothetical protein